MKYKRLEGLGNVWLTMGNRVSEKKTRRYNFTCRKKLPIVRTKCQKNCWIFRPTLDQEMMSGTVKPEVNSFLYAQEH